MMRKRERSRGATVRGQIRQRGRDIGWGTVLEE